MAFPRARAALLILALIGSLGCPTGGGDDDDSTPIIEPPAGCSNFSLAGVTFDFNIHWFGTDYPQSELRALLEAQGATSFQFPFEGKVTELGPDAATGQMAVTVEEMEPEDPPDDWVPNWMRIVYELPLGYDLPVELDQELLAFVAMDLSSGELVHGFAMVESLDDGGNLLFLAEPSTTGLVLAPGSSHPFFQVVEPVDRACPNLTEFQCAKLYNLAIRFQVRAEEPDGPLGETFELWPTEVMDFVLAETEFRAVNVWSYTHREINQECTGFDWAQDRMSYFVTRTASSPVE